MEICLFGPDHPNRHTGYNKSSYCPRALNTGSLPGGDQVFIPRYNLYISVLVLSGTDVLFTFS